MTSSPDAAPFQAARPLLFSIAYRMLGSAAEAEDVVQDAYLRYADAPQSEVRSPKDYLAKTVSRLCLDRLKSARMRREQYVGPWLPEPVVTTGGDEDPLRAVERRETITLAFLALLEVLTPQERAVFLMREVFEYEYADIAEALSISQANCRQLFHRAKAHVAEHRPRFMPEPGQQVRLAEQFLAATHEGDLNGLTRLLTEDVVLRADGGGKRSAASKPVVGSLAVAKVLIGTTRNLRMETGDTVRVTLETVNGSPALLVWIDDDLDTICGFTFDRDHISAVEIVRNPDKLAYAKRQIAEAGTVAESSLLVEESHGSGAQ